MSPVEGTWLLEVCTAGEATVLYDELAELQYHRPDDCATISGWDSHLYAA